MVISKNTKDDSKVEHIKFVSRNTAAKEPKRFQKKKLIHLLLIWKAADQMPRKSPPSSFPNFSSFLLFPSYSPYYLSITLYSYNNPIIYYIYNNTIYINNIYFIYTVDIPRKRKKKRTTYS